ncbi:pyridoxal phosphate-dependent aminotransferase [Arthrobacter sp. GCM10027362]|uniref:pyridoxal phosphate-dependent aminotransferase n=1 Tax=Arthrobacter sp. GCM10027362 TaxID=3273379 RepID=UPI0036317813
MRHLMTPRFRPLQGGLFSAVSKADVGEGVGDLIKAGVDVMAWADPFFPDPSIPPSVQAAMAEALASGLPSHYTMPIGSLDLRRAIAKKLAARNGIAADPSRNVLVTPGSDSGLLYAMMPFLEQGDEVLIPDPSYPSNFMNCRLLGAVPVSVPLRAEDGYQLDIAALETALTPRTKMVLLSHPNNPTSTVFRRETLEALARFIVGNDLILVCDQAFEDHVFDDVEMVSPAALPGMWERTVTVFSISKGLGLSGFRVGYLAADDRIMDALYGGAVNVLGATNTLSQIGAVAAFEDETILPAYFQILDRRRQLAHATFSAVSGVRMQMPESGMLSWLDVRALGTAAEVSAHILKHARVLVNEGEPYGSEGAGHLRIVHGCFLDEDRAQAAYARIGAALHLLARDRQLLPA